MKEIELIRKYFPELKFENYKDCSNGLDNKVLLIDNKYIFRFPKNNTVKENIKKEISLLKKIDSKYIPKYKWISEDFAGYKLIRGEELTREVFDSIENKEQFCEDIANFLTQLHSIKSHKGLQEQLTDSIQNLQNRLKVLSQFFNEDENNFIKKYTNYMKILQVPNNNVVHADLYWGHILVNNGKLSGIIDFTDCEIGDPAIDFHAFWDYGENVVKKIYEKYNGKKDNNFIFRTQLYHLLDYLSTLYYSETVEGKKHWQKDAIDECRKTIKSLRGKL